MTHRQYLVWQLWLDKEWNKPDRHDWQLMRIAEEVGKLIKLKTTPSGQTCVYDPIESYQVKFTTTDPVEKPEEKEIDVEAVSAQAKAVWRARINAFQGKPTQQTYEVPRNQ